MTCFYYNFLLALLLFLCKAFKSFGISFQEPKILESKKIPIETAHLCEETCYDNKYCKAFYITNSHNKSELNCYHIRPSLHSFITQLPSVLPKEVSCYGIKKDIRGQSLPLDFNTIKFDFLVKNRIAMNDQILSNFPRTFFGGCSYTLSIWVWLKKRNSEKAKETHAIFTTTNISPSILKHESILPTILYNTYRNSDKFFFAPKVGPEGDHLGIWAGEVVYDEWIHLAISVNNNIMMLYQNGQFLDFLKLDTIKSCPAWNYEAMIIKCTNSSSTTPYLMPRLQIANTILNIGKTDYPLINMHGLIENFVIIDNYAMSTNDINQLMEKTRPQENQFFHQLYDYYDDFCWISYENNFYLQLSLKICPDNVCGKFCLNNFDFACSAKQELYNPKSVSIVTSDDKTDLPDIGILIPSFYFDQISLDPKKNLHTNPTLLLKNQIQSVLQSVLNISRKDLEFLSNEYSQERFFLSELDHLHGDNRYRKYLEWTYIKPNDLYYKLNPEGKVQSLYKLSNLLLNDYHKINSSNIETWGKMVKQKVQTALYLAVLFYDDVPDTQTSPLVWTEYYADLLLQPIFLMLGYQLGLEGNPGSVKSSHIFNHIMNYRTIDYMNITPKSEEPTQTHEHPSDIVPLEFDFNFSFLNESHSEFFNNIINVLKSFEKIEKNNRPSDKIIEQEVISTIEGNQDYLVKMKQSTYHTYSEEKNSKKYWKKKIDKVPPEKLISKSLDDATIIWVSFLNTSVSEFSDKIIPRLKSEIKNIHIPNNFVLPHYEQLKINSTALLLDISLGLAHYKETDDTSCEAAAMYYFPITQYVNPHYSVPDSGVGIIEEVRLIWNNKAEGFAGESDSTHQLTEYDAFNGDAEAQTWLAKKYFWGLRGLKSDLKQAKLWFERAAAQNHPEALYNIGLFYKDGIAGYEKNMTKSLEYIKRSADSEKPFPMALNSLGHYYLHNNVDMNATKASEYLLKGLKLGSTDALFSLSYIWREGLLGRQNIPLSVALLATAASFGEVRSIDYLIHALYDSRSWLYQFGRENNLKKRNRFYSLHLSSENNSFENKTFFEAFQNHVKIEEEVKKLIKFNETEPIRIHLPYDKIVTLPFPIGSRLGSCQAVIPLAKYLSEMSYRPRDLNRVALLHYLLGNKSSAKILYDESSNLGVVSSQENVAWILDELKGEICQQNNSKELINFKFSPDLQFSNISLCNEYFENLALRRWIQLARSSDSQGILKVAQNKLKASKLLNDSNLLEEALEMLSLSSLMGNSEALVELGWLHYVGSQSGMN